MKQRPHRLALVTLLRRVLDCLPLAILCATVQARADVTVDARVTPLSGAFRYDIAITNNESDDLAIVSFADAPGADPLIDASLVVPIGFLASYDGVLGFVDFLGDTASFPPGSTIHGFRFNSVSGPENHFRSFEALTINGVSISGQVNTTVVPEAGTVSAASVLVGLALRFAWLRHRRAAADKQPQGNP